MMLQPRNTLKQFDIPCRISVEQSFEHCLGIPGLDAKLQPWIAGVSDRQHLSNVVRSHRADPQRTRLELSCRVQQFFGLALHRVQPRGDRVQVTSQWSQFYPPTSTEEQLDSVKLL